MVSRRTFLTTGAAVVAGSAMPVIAPNRPAFAAARAPRAGLSWPADQLLPSFAPPRHLDVGDARTSDGRDRLLLTTLQGVVNRRRPELYHLFDDVDATWLASTGVPLTHHDEPMDLVAKYADRVRGAILYDPAVPDTVNVATTMAGLEDAVVADAEQAARYGLAVLADLRGQFIDDPVQTYRWQLEHLFPRCTRRLLAGLPPTTVVDVPDVRWRELARETEQIRDSSNRGTYTFDLSQEIEHAGVAFLRFEDAFPGDGWGPSVRAVSVSVDGAQAASFEPGTAGEEKYLFDGARSSLGGEGNRFADGGGYFIYRFPAPPGAASMTVQVEMWNQYLVTATDTSPTLVEPFPFFRDYVVATAAMVSWLPPNGASGELLNEIFDRVAPTTPYAGWFSNDVAGEWSGVDLAATRGVEVIPADFYMNGTVHSGVATAVSARVARPPRVTAHNKIYLTLTFGEGDNVQYCQRHMRDLWDDPRRGDVPVNWTVSPLLADIGPALLRHYQDTATAQDLLIAGPSGAGYTYPGSWPDDELDEYMTLTGRYLRRTGMRLLYGYNHRDDEWWVPFSERIVTAYAEHTPVRGIIQSWERGNLVLDRAGIPVIGNFYPVGPPADYHQALLQHTADWDGRSPAFIAGAINAWNWTPTDVAELAGLLDERFEVVRGDVFFALLARDLRR
jgi:hypothetical protein